jgi:outer membrane protein TolC
LIRTIIKSLPTLIALWAPLALARAEEDRPANVADEPAPAIGANAGELPPPSPLPGAAEHEPYLIDLPTALRLANGDNPQIQFARERIRAAQARFDQAHVLWLPNLLVGSDWHRHDGQVQDIKGPVFPDSKSSLFVGPAASARFSLADALFEPLAARQFVAAREATARTVTNDTLLDVALGYWDLIRARSIRSITGETREESRKLDELSQSYNKVGKLKNADAERARADFRGRVQEVEATREREQIASIRLAQLLRLDPFVTLQPTEAEALPITLIEPEALQKDLAALALQNRPELAESQALVRLAIERMRQAKYGPLLPSVLLEYRGGGFGGGQNGFFGDFGWRSDFDAGLYWKLNNLGFGDRALQRERRSDVNQARIQEVAQMDRVVAEVAAALTRLRSQQAQMEEARLAMESATRSYELNWNLFKEGGIEAIRSIEVLQSLQVNDQSRKNYLDAIIGYNRAQFELHWALGYPVEHAGHPAPHE